MAYTHLYTIPFSNPQGEAGIVNLYKKDAPADTPLDLTGEQSAVTVFYDGSESKHQTIVSCQAEIKVRIRASDTSVNHNTFISDSSDAWRVIITIDTKEVFRGFLIQDEIKYQIKQKPNTIVLKATDGLGFLKFVPLTQNDGTKFNGRNTIISYVTASLNKAGLEIPTRVFCSLYESSMRDRFDASGGMINDMFTQGKLHHRTFEKDVKDFVSCYEALEIILGGWCQTYYWNGRWVISYRGELVPNGFSTEVGPKNYYTEYAYPTPVATGNQDLSSTIPIGKDRKIHPIENSQYAYYQYPVKSAKTTFNYVVPENRVNNERLQELGDFIAPLSGVGYSAWEKVGWSAETGDIRNGTPYAGAKNSYIKTEFNAFSVETDRYYVIEADDSIAEALGLHIRNDNTDFFVRKGDKIDVGLTYKSKYFESTKVFQLLKVALFIGGDPSDANNWYTIMESGAWLHNHVNVAFQHNTATTDPSLEWQSKSVNDSTIPADGYLIFYLAAGNMADTNEAHFKHIEITYTPYINGSLSPIKGNYWFTEQNLTIRDIIEHEILISDVLHPLIRGAIWREDGTTLTDPDWHRQNVDEHRHFTEFVNLAMYRHSYRRYQKIEGPLKGDMFSTEDNPTEAFPMCFHKHFNFPDITQHFEAGVVRQYVLVPPLTIDYSKGRMQAIFVEVFNIPEGSIGSPDAYTEGDTHVFNYEF